MASLTEELETELGPDPSATPSPARVSGGGSAPADGLFTRANSVDTVAILDWLGVPHESTPRGVMAQCPGCGEEGALVCRDGGLKCLHDRCAHAGPPDHRGFRNNAALAALVRSTDETTAAKEICRRFGLEREFTPRRREADLTPPPDDDPDYVPMPPDEPLAARETAAREPGEDAGESEPAADNVLPFDKVSRPKVSAWKKYGLQSTQDLLGMVYAEMKRPKEQRRPGVPTGNPDLDVFLGKFRPGNITTFGAKRSFGKTTYSIHVADVAMAQAFNVVMIAGEDSAMMYGKRLMARRAKLNAMRVRDFDITEEERAKAAKAWTDAPTEPFFLRAAGQPVEWMCQVLRELAKEKQIDLVIVDYLQCIKRREKSQDRRNEVTGIMADLVTVIREVDASGLIFSQLKRTERERPEIEDLKESGDIEDKSDHVLLGFKPDPQEAGPAKRFIIVAKNKDGIDPAEIDDIEIPYNSVTASFEERGPVATIDRRYDQFDDIADNSREWYP